MVRTVTLCVIEVMVTVVSGSTITRITVQIVIELASLDSVEIIVVVTVVCAKLISNPHIVK